MNAGAGQADCAGPGGAEGLPTVKVLMQARVSLFTVPGGDTVQMVETARALQRREVDAHVTVDVDADPRGFDLVHLFNLGRVQESAHLARRAVGAGVPVVLSPIYWDTSEFERRGHSGARAVICRILTIGLLVLAFAAWLFLAGTGCAPRRNVVIVPPMRETQVLVYGSSPGGVAAAIAAARSGASVLYMSELPWVGGTMTAEGVTCLDGGRGRCNTGILAEFKTLVYRHYGNRDATCQISDCTYEPRVGEAILRGMLNRAGVEVLTGYGLHRITIKGHRIIRATFTNGPRRCVVRPDVVVDGSWNGDIAAAAGCRYYVGQDPPGRFGEVLALRPITGAEQEVTYVITIKRYSRPHPIPRPAGYNPNPTKYWHVVPWTGPRDRLYSVYWYGHLPTDRHVMLNLADHPGPYACLDNRRQQRVANAARHTALCYLYWLQTSGGAGPNWSVADDQYPTHDGLPFRPYARDSRRFVCMRMMTERDLIPRVDLDRVRRTKDWVMGTPDLPAPPCPSRVATGSYPIDLHMGYMFSIRYAQTAARPYGIPYGSLVPLGMDNLLIGDMAIGASHLVHGSIRMQPSRMAIGQAAGTAAALCCIHHQAPRQLDVRLIQALTCVPNAHTESVRFRAPRGG